MRGLLVTFEGIEGSGKSTQAARLGTHLRERGLPVVSTREPGGTPLAERIRDLILSPAIEPVEPATELLLFLAARAQHVRRLIRPALDRGKIVICDRFTDATLAYQGGGRTISDELLRGWNVWATEGVAPDRTYFLDVPREIGEERSRGRRGSSGGPDRIEQEGAAFFEAVRNRYLEIARREPERIRVIRGTETEEAVARTIQEDVEALLASRAYTPPEE